MTEHIPEDLQRPADLPNFTNPPLDEVAIGLQFSSNASNVGEIVARYRESAKAAFPNVEYQPRLPPSPSPFEQNLVPAGIVSLPLPSPNLGGSFGRIWLVSLDKSQLIQIQDDRFIFNWRNTTAEYPNFEYVYEQFSKRYSTFVNVAKELGTSIQTNQTEVSYYNWFDSNGPSIEVAVRPIASALFDISGYDIRPDVHNWMSSYHMSLESIPFGRLTIQSQSSIVRVSRSKNEVQQGSTLNLTVASSVSPGDDEGALRNRFFSSRRAVVLAFKTLTTDSAQRSWGLVQ